MSATHPADETAILSEVPVTSLPLVWLGLVRKRLSQGELGVLPVVLGLVLIAIVFQALNSHFVEPLNVTNLMSQIAAMGTIAVGVVFVLLLGEIDLSVGWTSGFAAAVMAVLNVHYGVSAVVAVIAATLTGTVIGLFQGTWFSKLHVPAFVVTLAGYIGLQGGLLYVLGNSGTINLNDPFLGDIANRLVPVALGWAIAAALVALYAASNLRTYWRRTRAGLLVGPFVGVVARIILVAGGVAAAVAYMSVDRSSGVIPVQGVPTGVLLFVGIVITMDLVVRRTRFGRQVLAVGGNIEAARRAGIAVDRVRIAVFALASTLAAVGGILAASRLYAVNQNSGGGDVLLDSIAAAVIGGTSLFGGRGRPRNALLGALVIGAIANGMDLLALSSAVKYMITGGVLLLAVTIDAAARRGREASGRA
ncbi:MAG TPA: sugar ABC transporter permease [Candidatus Dormibacteraeota bacterium]|jgi:D-xylose transport system permease protein|nr:sugar ABC transporter permease [Candidatus Dormibacteraeota bacterium]